VLAATPIARGAPSAQWLRQIGDQAYWVAELGRSADLLIIGRWADDPGVSVDTIETALFGSGRPILISPAAALAALPETIVIPWKAVPEAARAVGAARPLLSQGAASTLLAEAAEQAALVVMGAYGNSRLRQWIFGGFHPTCPAGCRGTRVDDALARTLSHRCQSRQCRAPGPSVRGETRRRRAIAHQETCSTTDLTRIGNNAPNASAVFLIWVRVSTWRSGDTRCFV
jgi:hypothetical protein